MIKENSFGSKLFDVINSIIMISLISVAIYPIIYEIAISLSSASYVQANMVNLLPKGFNLDAYNYLIKYKLFWSSYANTIFYAVVGTAINLIFTCTLAFCLSRRELIFRKEITLFIIITMFFSGGMIPNFLLVKWLGIYNSIWAIVIPGAISTYNMIIVRTYIQGIPEEIIESVRIDGGNDFQIYTKIILPLSKSTIATIGLFYFVGHWNSYFNPMIYLKDRALMPLQVILKEMIIDMNMQNLGMNYSDIKSEMPTSEMVTASSIVISLIPVLCIYPFVQKYFVKGVMIGSVKG
jgi:putative aldouronate transport system permease protein